MAQILKTAKHPIPALTTFSIRPIIIQQDKAGPPNKLRLKNKLSTIFPQITGNPQ